MSRWRSTRRARDDDQRSDVGITLAARSAPLPTASDEPYVSLRGVSKTYGSGRTAIQVLSEIDIDIGAGELAVVAGPARSGKTTLLELIGGSRPPSTGQIVVGRHRIDMLDERGCLEFRTRNVALAPQTPTLAPTLTPYETVWQTAQLRGIAEPDRWSRFLLEAVGLQDDTDCAAAELSDEDQQRLSVARALAKDAPLLLADEPLSAATTETRRLVLSTLRQVSRMRSTTVILTAAETQSVPIADRLIRL
jgi:putative ABC transport system ATP-binding protein